MWIDWRWSAEKPYPEELDTVVEVKLRDGLVIEGYRVGWWNDDGTCRDEDSNWHNLDDDSCSIVAYKVMG